MNRPTLVSAATLASFSSLCLCATPLYAQVAYPKVDHIQGTLIQTAAAPVRPLLIDSASEVWAVNTGLSTVEHFGPVTQVPPAEAPLEIRHVPWGPVSIAEWDDPLPAVAPELLVVCRNTWGVLRMDKASGAYKEWIALPAEPSDIVVDAANGRAFVSCTGADAVVQINLTVRDGNFHVRYDEITTGGDLQLKSPYFLFMESNGRVRVAPLHSGNNTTATLPLFDNARNDVVSLVGRQHQLPDKDLFEINPAVGVTDAVTTVATGVGTILFAHGRNLPNGPYWVLNTDARNADEDAQSEPALDFDFVDNRVTFIGLSHAFVNFDPEPPFTATTAIGQPFALAFHPPSGRAFVAGLLTDNVTLFDPAAAPLHEIDLPTGSIPRGVVLAPANQNYLAVYCWGTARIEVYTTNHTTPSVPSVHVGGYALSNDPLPQDLKDGRRIFFDGELSARKNVSCASCHVDGGTDFLAWNLSGLPFDDKGPMVTQTLIGLERVSPFHWRGERSLEDFNTFAFPGLLGHTDPLSEADFAKFKAWLFALRNPANPFQNRARVIANTIVSGFESPTQVQEFRSDITALAAANPQHNLLPPNLPAFQNPPTGDAVIGLDIWRNERIFEGRWTCVQCHSFPLGTNNDVTDDEALGAVVVPERSHFKNAPFHEIWRKKQSLVVTDTQELGETQIVDVRAFLGTGVAHAGGVPDVLRFGQVASGNNFGFMRHMAALMQQWDQGIAPAAHYAYMLSFSRSTASIEAELEGFLFGQASALTRDESSTLVPNCDIAVIQIQSATVRKAWFLNRDLMDPGTIDKTDFVFSPDDADEPVRNLAWFISQAKPKFQSVPPSHKYFLFVGLPVGMAERFAADYDMDGKRNGDDAAALFTPNPADDTTPATIEKNELGYITTNSARLFVETDEPTTLVVSYEETGTSETQTVTSPLLSRVHTVLLTNLRPSTSLPVGGPGGNDDDPGATAGAEQVDYEWHVEATNAVGLVTPVTTHLLPSTEAFSIPIDDDAGLGSPVAQMRNEHVLAKSPIVTVGTITVLGEREVEVDLAAHLKQGPGAADATSRVFAVRVFRIRAGGDPLPLTIGAGLVNAFSGTSIVEKLAVTASGLTRQLAGTASLVVNTTPTITGAATLHFLVDASTVVPGDELVVQVEAVVESVATPLPAFVGCGSSSCTGVTVTTPFATALAQWDFPRTSEAHSQGTGTAPTP